MGRAVGHRGSMRLSVAALTAVLAALVALWSCGPAAAITVEPHTYSGIYPAGSFDGSDASGATPAEFSGEIRDMAIDQSNGTLYVKHVLENTSTYTVYKFNASGVSQVFTALAPATVLS